MTAEFERLRTVFKKMGAGASKFMCHRPPDPDQRWELGREPDKPYPINLADQPTKSIQFYSISNEISFAGETCWADATASTELA